MAKKADIYYRVDPWKIIETGFDPEYAKVSESVFSLGNEYMGIRGYFEEGYSGDSLLGSYQNGVYERKKAAAEGYKGIPQEMEFMVNSVDDLYLRILLHEKEVDLAACEFSDFERTLDMKSGLLKRTFLLHDSAGDLRITFYRLISMQIPELGVQRVEITSEGFEGTVKIAAGLNFDTHHGENEKHWNITDVCVSENNEIISVSAETKVTRIAADAVARLTGSAAVKASRTVSKCDHASGTVIYELSLTDQEEVVLDKLFMNLSPLASAEVRKKKENILKKESFDSIYRSNCKWWKEIWDKSDIEIAGDPQNQQGIRFCIFQMFQTYHGARPGTNIGAKGLTGEAYNGNAFWDTETYCLPFYLFHDPKAAKNLLYFRYATLPEARKRARELDCDGAFYPIATISGRECCTLWQHASLQLQASTAVAYGIWIYEKITGDQEFTKQYGFEMLAEISRMLATRGDYDSSHKQYGFYGVMGPDEFQMMVNHNAYTNYMAKFTFEFTCRVYDRLKSENPAVLEDVQSRIQLKESERNNWEQLAKDMYIPYNKDSGIFEQHDGYFKLPHVDVDAIPTEEFPLYEHWTYDRIYRNDMIKQPDVLMFLLLFNTQFSTDVIQKNYDFYEPRCIHESSLSPSVHSILAEQLDRTKEAYDFFGFATRMDLDNYNRNSGDGLHTTSIAAAWMNILFGFGGLRCDGPLLVFDPKLPRQWESYRFRLVYKDDVIEVNCDQKGTKIYTLSGKDVRVIYRGKERVINGDQSYLG